MVKKNAGSRATYSLEEAKKAVRSPASDRDLVLDERLEIAEFESAKRSLQIKEGELKLLDIRHRHQDQEANRKMRENYSKWVFGYLVGYSSVVAALLFISSIGDDRFHISDSVLEILVGSTALSAIGLVLAVTTGLFRGK